MRKMLGAQMRKILGAQMSARPSLPLKYPPNAVLSNKTAAIEDLKAKCENFARLCLFFLLGLFGGHILVRETPQVEIIILGAFLLLRALDRKPL